jgi:hypothetical protein
LLDAYFAGLFDGEGCINIVRRPDSPTGAGFVLHCSISMTDIEPLLSLKETFGGSISVRKRREHYLIQYTWRVSAAKALPFMKSILPFSIVKKAQIELGIKFQEECITFSKRISTANKEARIEMYSLMRKLKITKTEWRP